MQVFAKIVEVGYQIGILILREREKRERIQKKGK